MADFQVKLSDGVSKPAATAAYQIDVLTRSMRSLATQMIKADALGDDKKLGKLASQFSAVSSKLQALGAPVHKVGDGAPKVGTLTDKIDKLGDSLARGQAPGGAFGQMLEALGPEAIAAAAEVAVLAAGVVAVGAALYKGAEAAIQIGDQRRQMTATFGALTGNGKGAVEMLDRLSDRLPFTTEQMGAWAKTIAAAGERDLPSLERGVRASGAALAIMGEGAPERLSALIARLKAGEFTGKGPKDLSRALRDTGVTAEDVGHALGKSGQELSAMIRAGRDFDKVGAAIETAVITKGKGAVSASAMSWDSLTKKFHENALRLFEGVADTPGFKDFIGALQTILRAMGQMEPQGQSAKRGITSAFGAMFEMAAKLTWKLATLSLEVSTFFIRMYIATYPFTRALQNLWNEAKGSRLLTGALWTLAIALGAVGLGVFLIMLPVLALVAAFVAVGAAISYAVGALIDFFSISDEDALGNVGDGMAVGVNKAIARVEKAGNTIGGTLTKSVNKKLDAHSPSRVMMGIGADAVEGFAIGVNNGAPRVGTASARVANETVSGANSAPTSRQSTSYGPITLNVYGSEGQSAREIAEETLDLLIERIGLSQGLPAGT